MRGVDGRLSWRWRVADGGVVRRRKRERNWQRRPSRVVPRKLQGYRRGTCGGEEVGAQVHLTRTVVRACGRRINRCHHGDRTLVARRHGVIPRYDRPLRRPHLPPRGSVVRGVAVLYTTPPAPPPPPQYHRSRTPIDRQSKALATVVI